MTTELYRFIEEFSEDSVLNFVQDAARIREEDIEDFNNLSNTFIKGRKVDKIPLGSSDTSDNRVGDFNYDANYLYICVDNSGTAEWRRVAIGSW